MIAVIADIAESAPHFRSLLTITVHSRLLICSASHS
jgi:hypothetical protein